MDDDDDDSGVVKWFNFVFDSKNDQADRRWLLTKNGVVSCDETPCAGDS